FANVRKGGIIAINIESGDHLIEVKLTRGSIIENDDVKDPGDDVVLITREGMSIRFGETDVRSMGRAAGGVKGITLEASDLVGAMTVRESDGIMLITIGGQMVRIFVKDIREAGRNTQGVKLINLAEGDKLQAIAPVISEQQEAAAADTQSP